MKNFVYVFVAVLLMCTVAFSFKNTGKEVGVKVSVSQKALTYLKNELLPRAEAAALAAEIPDMVEETKVPVMGEVELALKNIKLNRLSMKNSSIHLNSGNSIVVSITGLNLDITLNWHYRQTHWPHIADSGTGEASTARSAGTIVLVLGSDVTGHPTAKISGAAFDMSDLSIKLHGGSSWLYDMVIELFHKKIVKALDEGLVKVLTGDVQTRINKYLSEVPVQYVLGKHIALDYSLADPDGIVIYPDKLLVGSVAGEFFPAGGRPGQAPGKPVVMPYNVTNTEFEIFITDFSVESLGYTAVTNGLAQMLITQDMVPGMAKDFFTTDFYGQYAPGLIDKYGAGAEVALFIAVTETPDVIFSTKDEVDVKAGVDLTVRGKNAAGSFEDAFTLLVSCDVDADAGVNESAIFGQLTRLNAIASLVKSQVGDVDIEGFNELVQFAVSMGIEAVNEILAKGAPLPTIPGLKFVKPTIIYRDDYIVVATDISFTNLTRH